jgi:hypothetical protein
VCVPVASDGSRAPDSFTLEVSLHPVSLFVYSDRRRDSRGVWLQWLLVAVLPVGRLKDSTRGTSQGRVKEIHKVRMQTAIEN